ncbi:Beta-glucosidase BoGH3B [Sesamum alatum]|uniref:Beta-glucosidase BoGH3B n=1 Tax=Sesamum alatum TaxID=300844 RepID=A0AAE2CS86_9LAMI|nr:Beta-glucosidase BoGH3B [Sesamum alatum]
MTLEEKIGQMTQIERTVTKHDVMTKYFMGSVLSGGGSVPAKNAPPEKWVDMVNKIQKSALSTHLGIPMIYGIDAVHGNNNVYKATIFPHNIGLGATRDPELVKKIGAATAPEIRATGVPYAFAPCIAEIDLLMYKRAFPMLPDSKQNVAACAKHYVGDGGTVKGINENNTIATWSQLLRLHMPAYYDSVIKGVSTIMISYSSWNGKKMHANRDLITGFLKKTQRFRGFVISDWEAIDRITSPLHANYTYSIETSINAHREIARKAVRKSLVLLKNGKSADQPLLPLPKKAEKILVAGTHADNIGNQCGGWTIDGTKRVAISLLGQALLKMFCASRKCVVVLVTGRPIVFEPYLSQVDALVAAWLPGSEGQGVADVLFGDYGFTGKLPITWFKNVKQLPMNFGDKHYDSLVPLGYGLTTNPVN